MADPLIFFVPSNRTDKQGNPTHVDGWNEILRAYKSGWPVGATLERQNVHNVAAHCKAAMMRKHWKPLVVPAIVYVRFVETSRRRDIPNIYGGLKWLLDGLTRPRGKKGGAGAIVDDSQRWLAAVYPSVIIDKEHPGVWVRIESVDED